MSFTPTPRTSSAKQLPGTTAEEAGVGGGVFELEVNRCLALIAGAPERWSVYLVRRQPLLLVRRYVMQNYPYILYYYVEGETVVVVVVMHTSRRPDYWIVRVI